MEYTIPSRYCFVIAFSPPGVPVQRQRLPEQLAGLASMFSQQVFPQAGTQMMNFAGVWPESLVLLSPLITIDCWHADFPVPVNKSAAESLARSRRRIHIGSPRGYAGFHGFSGSGVAS